MAVTFDGGYKDHYEIVMHVLIQHQISSTLCIISDHIKENKPFKHDIDNGVDGL
jgi:peptidoglycan/xylan/chitin deacetylase (PgdA/CDA1 family)